MPKTSNKPAPKKKPPSKDALKQAVKDAVVEAIKENPEVIHAALLEALEDIEMARAIEEGRKGKTVSREEVFRILRTKG